MTTSEDGGVANATASKDMQRAAGDIRKVLIVGGGVGGLALAIRLLARGVAVRIVDSDPEWGAVGAGLTINGMTLKAFGALGVLDEIRANAHVHGGRRYLDPAGHTVSDTPAYMPDVDDVTASGGILRPVLHAILKRRALALGVEATLGTTIRMLEHRPADVLVSLADGTEWRADLVVGADGLRSAVRRLIFPDAPQPRFTGQGAWRALFPRPPEIATGWAVVGGPYKGVGLNPVSDSHMYLHLLENVPDNPWRPEEEWPALLAERLGSYGGFLGSLADRLDAASQINYRPLETLLLPPPWHVGRVALIGDAAHAATPHAAYGAGLAVEDALVLARMLEFPAPLAARLRTYADLRYERCRSVVEASLHVGTVEMENRPAEEWHAAFLDLRQHIWQPLPEPVLPDGAAGR